MRETGPRNSTGEPGVVVVFGPSYCCFLGTVRQGCIGELGVARGIKTGPVRDILDLFPAKREFGNNPGKRFKIKTSGRHTSREVFKIKAALFFGGFFLSTTTFNNMGAMVYFSNPDIRKYLKEVKLRSLKSKMN